MIRDAGRVAWAVDVDNALTTLDADEESFIRLSYFGGLDNGHIAESAGVSTASVSRTMATGMQRLGRALALLPVAVAVPVSRPAGRHAVIEPTFGDFGPELATPA